MSSTEQSPQEKSAAELSPDLSPADVVRAGLESYLAQDRARSERLIAEEFDFTSPQDDHIDRATFFERCFPTADRLVSQQILAVGLLGASTAGVDVFVLYEYELKAGGRYRNAEVQTVRDGQIRQAQVFFGGRV
ncbi:MAG TPA: hypothetical protein VES60_04460 [Nakamurella sp.]|nr:hypothetical protein [Nakamurella sp.]